MKSVIKLLSIAGILVSAWGCTNQSVYQKMEDYEGEDYAVISVLNFGMVLFQAYDQVGNCLIKEPYKEWKLNGSMRLMNDGSLFGFGDRKSKVVEQSPHHHYPEHWVEYKVRANRYVRVIMNPGQGIFAPELTFFVEKGHFYSIDFAPGTSNPVRYRVMDLSPEKWRNTNKEYISSSEWKPAKEWDIELCK